MASRTKQGNVSEFETTHRACAKCGSEMVFHKVKHGRPGRVADLPPTFRACHVCAERAYREQVKADPRNKVMRVFNANGSPNHYKEGMH